MFVGYYGRFSGDHLYTELIQNAEVMWVEEGLRFFGHLQVSAHRAAVR